MFRGLRGRVARAGNLGSVPRFRRCRRGGEEGALWLSLWKPLN